MPYQISKIFVTTAALIAMHSAFAQSTTQTSERRKPQFPRLAQASQSTQSAATPSAAATTRLPEGIQLVTSSEGITEYRLANGLQLLVFPENSKALTVVNMTVRVGSRHEITGQTGVAHLLEHLLFKGTPRNPAPWAEFTRRGLRANGTTSTDRTNYYASFGPNEETMRWYVDWLADALVNSNIAKADLDSEMTVVRNEMERGENDPGRIMGQRIKAAAYAFHPYGRPVIGARSDVETVPIESIQAFYRNYYRPDNTTLIISGAFDLNKTLALVSETFGKLKSPSSAIPQPYTTEPLQDGEREVTLRRATGTPFVSVMYRVPRAAHPDSVALSLAAAAIANGPSARLYKRLVETNLATEVGGYTAWSFDPGSAMFGADGLKNADLPKLRDKVLELIEGIEQEPISAADFERAKGQYLEGWKDSFNNPDSIGLRLTEFVAMGDWKLMFIQRDRAEKLKAEDLNRVAKAYFVRDNRTVGMYYPGEATRRASSTGDFDLKAAVAEYQPKASLASAEEFAYTLSNIDARTIRGSLPNGLRYALVPKATRGNTVILSANFRSGNLDSLKGQSSAASFAGALLDAGSANISKEQLRDKLLALKSQASFGGSTSGATLSMKSEKATVLDALALAAEVLRKPSYDSKEIERLRQARLQQIDSDKKDPVEQLSNALARHEAVYPPEHPYYTPTFDEAIARTKGVTREQIVAFHRDFYGANFAEVVVVGDFDAQAMIRALEKHFGDWKSSNPYQRIATNPKPNAAKVFQFEGPDQENANFSASLTVPINVRHPDYPALTVASSMLGQGGSSRLWKRIREKDGLSYGVGAYISWANFDNNSTWTTQASFASPVRDKVVSAWREELALALKDGFTDKELQDAKQSIMRSRQLGRAQDSGVSGLLGLLMFTGLSIQDIAKIDEAFAAVTLEQANQALRKYIDPSKAVLGFSGNFGGRQAQ
jgi:zinc protease